ncbi:MAG: T9SS type A sorting domain-containing protein [bacterium]
MARLKFFFFGLLLQYILFSQSSIGQINPADVNYSIATDSNQYADTSTIYWRSVVKNVSSDTIHLSTINCVNGDWLMTSDGGIVYDGFVFAYEWIVLVDLAPHDSLIHEWKTNLGSYPYPAGKYYGIFKPWEANGAFEYDSVGFVINNLTSLQEHYSNDEMDFQLYQNYPNPFNPTTSIKYQVPRIENVSLKVYDILGNEVATLVNEQKEPGFYEVEFNASNLSSGVYFYLLRVGDNFNSVKKMIVLK